MTPGKRRLLGIASLILAVPHYVVVFYLGEFVFFSGPLDFTTPVFAFPLIFPLAFAIAATIFGVRLTKKSF